MERDEVSSGSERVRPRPPAWLLAVPAVALLAVAATQLVDTTAPGEATPGPATTAGPDESGSNRAPEGAAPSYSPTRTRPTLRLSGVCPVRVFRDSVVSVSFTLTNVTPGPVTVLSATAVLPQTTLRSVATFVEAGSCQQRLAGNNRVVQAGQALLVTFHLTPTTPCPASSPVLASVLLRGDDGVVAGGYVDVRTDLADVPFPSCPQPTATAARPPAAAPAPPRPGGP